MASMRLLMSRCLAAAVTFLVAFVVAELGFRLAGLIPSWDHDRVLFFSRDNWELDDRGAPRYVPNSKVRTVAIYGTRVEYDVTFATNNLGRIDHLGYPLDDSLYGPLRLAVVGNSFTAGFHGGDPWVPRLRRSDGHSGLSAAVYNLGVGATGFAHFEAILQSSATQFEFDSIAVVFISSDLRRRAWYPLQTDQRVFLCPPGITEERCLERNSRLLVLPNEDEPISRLIDRASELGFIERPSSLFSLLRRHTVLGSELGRLTEGRRSIRSQSLDGWDRRAPRRLRDAFPQADVVFIQIPEKREAIEQRLRIDPANDMRSAGLSYVSLLEACDLDRSDYFDTDPHPNRRGYRKILRCVRDVLTRRWPKAASERDPLATDFETGRSVSL